MKNNKKILKYSVFFLTLLKIIILCNVSVVFADSNAPTECRVSINNNALYTNNRYVTLELYGTDADPMQVWISNDGETGTVLDFAYNKTISITDINYTVGVTLDSSNSTISTNSDNVLRIENWPLSSVNGTKKVYAVFRDAYGNKTSVNGLSTITITYNLNGGSGNAPTPTETVKNLGVYLPEAKAPGINRTFLGWSTSQTATLPGYYTSFNANITLYAVYKTIALGDYVYYPIDLTKPTYEALSTTTGTSTQTYTITDVIDSSPVVFRVLYATEDEIILCPNLYSQTFNISFFSGTGINNGINAIMSVCSLYGSEYSSSTDVVTQEQMARCTTIDGLNTLFSNSFWITPGTYANINGIGYKTLYEPNPYGDGGGTGYTQSCNVCPAITLSSRVIFSNGLGTINEPYSLSLSE